MENKYEGAYLDPEWQSLQDFLSHMESDLRPTPRPREIKHVVLDADDTMWDLEPWGIASLAVPIGKTDGNELAVRYDTQNEDMPEYLLNQQMHGWVRLKPSLRRTLARLKEKGIGVSVASTNDKRTVDNYIKAFELENEFTNVEANWQDYKGDMVQRIADRNNIDTKNIIFVDDAAHNVHDVEVVTDALGLQMGRDIFTLDEILEYIK